MVDVIEKLAAREGIDFSAFLAESQEQEQLWRDAGMKGEHPQFSGFKVGEYFDEDGILRDVSGNALECRYKTEQGYVYFPIKHESDLAQSDEAKARWRIEAKQRCFKAFSGYEQCTFDDSDDIAVKACMSYANDFATLSKAGMGLILFGRCGVGKTHLAACICNALIDKGHRCLMANAQMLSDEGAKKWGGLSPMLEDIGQEYELIVLDDYGRENGWSKARLFECVDYFYRNRVPMIVTTNMDGQHLSRPNKDEVALIERLKERCNRIEVVGVNHRQMIAHVE